MGIQINGNTDTISAIDGSLNLTGAELPSVTNLNATGIITASSIFATTATISGNVSIAGTVTYEDVTNVDSIGIVTARSGVRVNTGGLVVTAGVSTFTNGPVLIGSGTSSGTALQRLQVTGGALIDTSADTTSGLGIGIPNPSTRVHIGAQLNGSVGGLFIDSKTRDSGETNVPLLRIDSGGAGGNQVGALWFNTSGSLGIGTTSINVNNKLAVVGSATNATVVIANTSSFTGGTNFTTPHLVVQNSNDVTGNVTRLALVVGNGGQSYIESLMENSVTSYASMIFRTRGSEPGVGERMRLNSSGNLGIGTNNPSNRMHLYSTTDGAELLQLEIGGQPANTQKGSIIWRATQTGGSSAKLASVGSTAINNWGGELVFSTKPANGSPNDNIVERVRINASGNVGVGYDNPSYKLAVNGDIFAGGNIIMNNNEQVTTMFSNTVSNVSNNTWYTVTNFAFQYNLIAFLLFVAFENSSADGNNVTALFMSPTTTAYAGGGAAPFKIAGATALEAQIVNSSPYNLQVRITTGADGGSKLRWWGFTIPGN